jgi:hypothetical protein
LDIQTEVGPQIHRSRASLPSGITLRVPLGTPRVCDEPTLADEPFTAPAA